MRSIGAAAVQNLRWDRKLLQMVLALLVNFGHKVTGLVGLSFSRFVSLPFNGECRESRVLVASLTFLGNGDAKKSEK